MTIPTLFDLKPLHPDFLITDDGLFFAGAAGSKLIHAIDSNFRRMALAAGAEERKFPTVIAEDTLNRSEYFQSFPQYASSVIRAEQKSQIFSFSGCLLPLLRAFEELGSLRRNAYNLLRKVFSRRLRGRLPSVGIHNERSCFFRQCWFYPPATRRLEATYLRSKHATRPVCRGRSRRVILFSAPKHAASACSNKLKN